MPVRTRSQCRNPFQDSSSSCSLTEEEEEELETDVEEEEFQVDPSIMKNPRLKPKVERVIHYILENTPTMEEILRTPMRLKNRAKIFELFLIYEQTLPMTEERMVLRTQLEKCLTLFKQDYRQFVKHKTQILLLEKDAKNYSEYGKLQEAILNLNTTTEIKLLLYRKFTELRENIAEGDNKLKTWLKEALRLPYDNLVTFPQNSESMQIKLLETKKILDEELYGMAKVKEQLLLFLHTKILNPESKGACLGLIGPPGVGKCLDPFTPVLLYNGRVVFAKEIRTGDLLMGDDGTMRRVLSTTTGTESMFWVRQSEGDDYRVNYSHILTLYNTITQCIEDVTLAEYKRSPEVYLGVRRALLQTPITQVLPFDAYVVGSVYAKPYKVVDEDCLMWVTRGNLTYSLCLHMSIEDRMQFLMGYLETVGAVQKGSIYEMPYQCRETTEFIQFMAQSVGFRVKDKILDMNLPKESFLYYPITLEYSHVDTYYGFTLDGNGRFLLGDFTVTHNTSIAKCLARAMQLPFEQISFGGATNSDFIKGHDYTYVGSRPGEIVRCLSRMKYKNGILFFDEYEKVSKNQDIVAALLHITDFSQNHEFRDNYLCDIPIDLSSIWFIYSMNEMPEDNALKDRIFPIEIEGYTEKEKVEILRLYLVPKYLKNLNLSATDVVIPEKVAAWLVNRGDQSKGIREIERLVKDMLTKLSFIASNDIPMSFRMRKVSFPLTLDQEMAEVLTRDTFMKKKTNMCMYI